MPGLQKSRLSAIVRSGNNNFLPLTVVPSVAGVPGAQYTLSILDVDGNVLKTGNFTVDADGYGVLLLNYYR